MSRLHFRVLLFAALLPITTSVWADGTVTKDPDPARDKTYKQLELFSKVLSYIQNNYVEPVDEKQLIYGAIKGMVDTLDPHTLFMPPDMFKEMKIDTSGEFGALGIEISKRNDQIVVVSAVDDTPAQRAGIKSGDQIVEIDGESTRSMDVNRAGQKMRGPAGKKVMLTIMREGFTAPRPFAIVRDHIRIASVESELYAGIGYVKIKNFQDRTDVSMHKELDRLRTLNGNKELRGVVLDLRNNPGGLLDQAIAVSDRFLAGEVTIVSTRGRGGKLMSEEKSKDRDTEKNYPMVVLVNGGSASASEIVAGALQDNKRATIIGVPTFGKGSVQTVIELEDGSGFKITIARYYTPSGRSIQEKGIRPEFLVPEKEGGALPKEDGFREKNISRHLKAEIAAEGEVAPLKANMPERMKAFEGSDKLGDFQLKIALEYLNGMPAKKL